MGNGTVSTWAKNPKSNWAMGNDLGLSCVLKGMLRRLLTMKEMKAESSRVLRVERITTANQFPQKRESVDFPEVWSTNNQRMTYRRCW